VVDALDECPPDGRREELLELIVEITVWGLAGLHLLVTSRPEPDIEEALTLLLTISAIPIQGESVELDIELHISQQLENDPKLMKWPKNVEEEIKYTLMAGANGMYATHHT
jgi:hypothetical protein